MEFSADIIYHCYDEHLKLFDGKVKFTFEQYEIFWKNHQTGSDYKMKNRNGSMVDCKIAYYPLPYYDDLRAMIEIPMKDGFDFRDVPVHFLQKI